MATDLTLSVDDRPGGLASVGEALGAAGINIEGLLGIGMEGRGIIHICVQDGAAAKTALEGAGIKVEGETDVIVGDLPPTNVDTPGAMGGMMRNMADAGINVSFAYLATKNRIVISTSDNAKVRELMAKM
jgi:hypothetical protein